VLTPETSKVASLSLVPVGLTGAMPNTAVYYHLKSFAPGRWRVQTDETTLNKISAALPATLF
jgi:hypothetical protein